MDGVTSDMAADALRGRSQSDGRGVIETAFDLLDLVGALEPARLIDLVEATGIPRPTVHRLLLQLIGVGAVRRDGIRYRLGASLLGLGARVTPERGLRDAARRPMAELAAATAAAVNLSATIGNRVVFLDAVDARMPLGFIAEPGARVPRGSAPARAHRELRRTAPIVDAGSVLANISCVAAAVPLGTGEVAAVSAVVTGMRPPTGLVAATRVTAARIASVLHASQDRTALIFREKST